MKLLITILLPLVTLMTSCTHQEDAKKASKNYCSCMEKNGYPSKRVYAGIICHAELVKNNRLYRIFFIDKRDETLANKLTSSTMDSANNFMLSFVKYIPIKMRETTTDIIISTSRLNLQTGRTADFLIDQEVIYNNSQSKKISTGTIKDGLIHDNDWLSTYYYKNGKKNGIFTHYYKRNRKLHVLGFYKNDEPIGSWYFFNEDGGVYLIEDIKGVNKYKRVKREDGVMITPPFISYRKEYNSKTGELKREGMVLFDRSSNGSFYKYGDWIEYETSP